MSYAWPEDTDFALVGTRCPRSGLPGLRAHDAHLRSPLSPLPYPRRARWNWSASSTTVPIPPAPGTPRPRAPSSKSPSLCPIGPSAGMSSVGSVIAAVRGTGRSPRSSRISCDAYGIKLSEDAIAQYIRRYQVMLAARQQDPEALRRQYEAVDEIILSIDGLQPEKGHETLYVVRELTRKRVWFAEALISATADEVRRLIAQAKEWAEALGKPVALWMSDKQDAFVTGIAAEFPDVPHRYCQNHFLRDVAKPVLEADSHAKVQMRKKVRGLRKIEQAVLKRHDVEASEDRGRRRCRKPRCTVTVDRRTRPRRRPIRRAPWCSTTARRCAASSTTIRVGRCTLPACGWPRPWMRSANRSNGTWTRKKGVRGEATGPLGRLHRPRPRRSRGRTRDDPRLRQGHRGGRRDPGSRERGPARTARRSSRS